MVDEVFSLMNVHNNIAICKKFHIQSMKRKNCYLVGLDGTAQSLDETLMPLLVHQRL
uniref:Uncharacterized protein n=1 Tax=Romanomermis culicivorax TaxID=13658 RepID=A0A915HSZ7_ROMCU